MKMKQIRSEKESYTVKNSQLIWHFGEFCITHAIEKKMLLVYLLRAQGATIWCQQDHAGRGSLRYLGLDSPPPDQPRPGG